MSPVSTLSSGTRSRIVGQMVSKLSWAIPLEMIRWVAMSIISLRNSAWVSGRFSAFCISTRIG